MEQLEQMLQSLMQGMLRLEVLQRAIIEVLEKKTGPDGKPLMTKEEINVEAEKIKEIILEQAKRQSQIVKPSLIVPPDAA